MKKEGYRNKKRRMPVLRMGDSDPNVHFDADPVPERHQNDAADPTQRFTNFGKSEFFHF
jgi:hypothetical protein